MTDPAALSWFARVRGLLLFRRLDDALQLLRSLGPYKGLGILVVAGNEVQQEFLQFSLRGMNTLRQALLAQDAEKNFHQVDPRSVGRGVVEMRAGMPLQPAPRCFVLVDVEIVENHVQLSLRESADHIVEEAQEVDRSAALFDMGHDFTSGNLQSRQQGLRAVTNVLIGPAVGRLGSAPAAPLPGHILQVDRNEGHPGDPPALGWQNNGAICQRSLRAFRARQRFADCSCRQQPPKQSDIAALDPAEWMVT